MGQGRHREHPAPRRLKSTELPTEDMPLHDPHRRRLTVWCLAAGAAAVTPTRATALAPAAGTVVLTLTGKVLAPNQVRQAEFDMAMLERLAQTSFTTRTPWYAQARRFTGPLLRDVLAAAGASGTQLQLSSLNDYRVTMPVDDALRFDVILARLVDGQPMAVRDKGPLFVIYPFDSHAELRSVVYYSRCAWQLRSIEVQ